MRLLNVVLFLLSFQLVMAQEKAELRVPGEFMVQLRSTVEVADWIGVKAFSSDNPLDIRHARVLSERLNIHLISFPEAKLPLAKLEASLNADPTVLQWQANHELEFRNTPNDIEYFRQWDMELIDAPRAWQISTGGTTAQGTPIVVAVMDSGFDPAHEDLQENLWQNPHEIPGDGLDNDNNGYVDDILGWDFFSDSPNIAPGNHGLSTAAIVGAKGNNGKGVTGVNWDIQLMLFSFNTVSDLVEAYEYVIEQRRRFNTSGGTDGAFVVATNNSFGQTGISCNQQPIWGAMYDEMGAVGILSSSGVSNQQFDVEEFGDMPANCTSDYLLISCNTTQDDNLYETSAFGAVSVDIGSPGEASVTAKPSNTYGFFGGNSAATPHVTGAIALLYSTTCEGLEDAAINDPAGTALLVKDVIMQSGDQTVALEGRTLTGRRLNIGTAMADMETRCENTLGPLELANVYPNPVRDLLTVEYVSPENGTYRAELYDVLGRLVRGQDVPVAEFGLRRFTVDVASLPAGTYFLRFGSDSEWVSKKVVVM